MIVDPSDTVDSMGRLVFAADAYLGDIAPYVEPANRVPVFHLTDDCAAPRYRQPDTLRTPFGHELPESEGRRRQA